MTFHLYEDIDKMVFHYSEKLSESDQGDMKYLGTTEVSVSSDSATAESEGAE